VSYGDAVEARALYDLLEKEVVPTFYDRDPDGVPRAWVAAVKRSIRHHRPGVQHEPHGPRLRGGHVPAANDKSRAMMRDRLGGARELLSWKERVRATGRASRIDRVEEISGRELPVFGALEIESVVRLGELSPDDVVVEAFSGRLDARSEITDAQSLPMKLASSLGEGRYLYRGRIPCGRPGRTGTPSASSHASVPFA